jgi:amino acid transporter
VSKTVQPRLSEGVDAGSGADALAKGSVTLTEVLFVSIVTMAPGAGAAYAIMSGAPFAGGSLPLAVAVALIGCVLVAVSIGQLAKHMASAAGLASYVGKAIHSTVGFVTAWAYPFVYLCAVPYLCLVFGNLLAGSIVPSETGASFTFTWVVATLVCLVGAFLLNFFGAKFGTIMGVILGSLEIVVFIILALWMIISAGDNNTAAVLTPAESNAPGFEGMSGVIAASVYGFLAFIGFEAAAPLAAETRNPKRNVPRAIVGAALLVGVFFLFTTYAATVFFGPSKFSGFLEFNGGNGWLGIAQNLWGAGWILLVITLMNSCLACASGGAMAATRAVWAMAHHRTIPRVFAKVHPRWRSPVNALYLVFGLAGIFTFAVAGIWGPVTGFLLFGSILTITVLPIYVVAALACPIYYFRYRRSEFNILLHLVIPVLAAAFLTPAFLAGAGIPVFSFVAPLTYPLNLAGPIAAVWYLIGIAVMLYLLKTRPQSLTDLAMDVDDPTDEPPSQALDSVAVTEPTAPNPV